ncbi:MAG: PTS sugar transporter subunit IIC [Smithella sp.]
MLTKIILLSFCGGLLCLDRVFIQTMISRPVVVAPFIGLLLNNIYAGLIIGVFVELFWIDRLPLGAYIPPNDTIAAVLATSIAILAGQNQGGVSPQITALAFLLAVPFGIIAGKIDALIIESNNTLSDQALEDARTVNIKAIERKNYLGLLKVFFVALIYLLAVQSILIPAVIWIYPKLGLPIMKMLALLYHFLPLLGIAVAVNTINLPYSILIYCAFTLILIIVWEFFRVY